MRTLTLTQIHRENGRLYVRWTDDAGAVTEQEFNDVQHVRDYVGDRVSEDILKALALSARIGSDPALSQSRPLVMRRVLFDETTGRVEVV